jgi:L-aminoadipate-semialdehyde dehydrogenase
MNGTTVLPDPTVDLHWNEFCEPIDAFFDANTAKYPHRVCVIGKLCHKTFDLSTLLIHTCSETATAAAPHCEFSCKQIYQASNILANHLIQSGIERLM